MYCQDMRNSIKCMTVFSYLAQMTQEKEGKWNIDIGASVGDTLAAIWNYTDDFVLCIEPVKKIFGAFD